MFDRRVHVTQHCLERYQEFYPLADPEDALKAIWNSDEMDPSIANRLRGHQHDTPTDCHFLLHPERTGFFVISMRHGLGMLKPAFSFIRFPSLQQHELAVRLYGFARPVTATGRCRWVLELAKPTKGQRKAERRELARRNALVPDTVKIRKSAKNLLTPECQPRWEANLVKAWLRSSQAELAVDGEWCEHPEMELLSTWAVPGSDRVLALLEGETGKRVVGIDRDEIRPKKETDDGQRQQSRQSVPEHAQGGC